MSFGLIASAILAAAIGGASAHADPPAGVDVAVLRPAADDRVLVEATARLGLELGASGLTSTLVDVAGDEAPARVAFVREDGVATIDLVGTPPDAPPLYRRIRVPREQGGDDPAVLAVRAVELLRDIRLAVRRAPPEKPAPTRAGSDEPPAPRPEDGILQVSIGTALLEGHLDLAAATIGPTVSIGARMVRHVSIVATFAGPFFLDLVPTPAGSAHTREELGSLGLRVDAGGPRLRGHVLLASGFHHLHATYDARGVQSPVPPPELHIRSAPDFWTPLAAVGAGVSGRVWRWIGASFELTALFLNPTIDVSVDGRSVGRMGGPSLLQTLSLWTAFP